MKNTSLGILSKLAEAADYPKFEEDLMQHVKEYLEGLASSGKAEISDVKVFYNIEGSYVCQYTLEGETFLVTVDML